MINKELTFLSSYGIMLDGHHKSVDDFILSCRHVAKEYYDEKGHAKEDRYNIFHIISDLYYRENFHSDLISFFLEPNANHGCSHLMLDIFIAMLNKAGCDIDNMNYSDAVVVREQARIDILISSEESKRAIVIENKINNASDMPRQLPRYYDYVSKKYSLDAIVYLPLDFNKKPNMDDWTEEDRNNVLPLLKIIPAYDRQHRTNIVDDWLLPSLPKIDKVDVLSTIRQYADLIISLNKFNMDNIILEKFRNELLKGDNLKTAQSVRNMLNELPAYLAQRIYYRFSGSCSPFENVWIYRSWDTVFEKAIVDDIYLKMDIWCYEERYDVLFWTPTPEVEESAFNSCVAKIHSLKQFSPKSDARNQLIRHFAFTEETVLLNFIQELLTELHTIIYKSKK